ncbi:unnamed protein product [Darwinula stevensoni]|uniref:Peptidase S1 domain-containing protein n=1 Tax=Darwinula stevensoni TaxID=69355 RepID=A0A7R8XDI0_9CRUS|nr:unnamed protein product [Darwinula stevensoni]CAG0894781.1 unnamed protein product [Darwinula stevensoni]
MDKSVFVASYLPELRRERTRLRRGVKPKKFAEFNTESTDEEFGRKCKASQEHVKEEAGYGNHQEEFQELEDDETAGEFEDTLDELKIIFKTERVFEKKDENWEELPSPCPLMLHYDFGNCTWHIETGDKSGSNPLLKFPSEIIGGMTNLEKLWSERCNLGPTLTRGFLEFHSKSLKEVHLSSNNISALEPGAITGLGPNTLLDLSQNEIAELSGENFRPILDHLLRGNGTLALSGNPIECDCDMSWLVLGQKYLEKFSGKCGNGTEFKDLDMDYMTGCDRQCPYQCVKLQWYSFCNPETVTLFKGGQLSVRGIMLSATVSDRGKPSEIGEWPWQAGIYDVEKGKLVCGGALIQEQSVLTAAHCVAVGGTSRARKTKNILVYLGKHYRSNARDDELVQVKEVSRIIIHKDFQIHNFDGDIALLRLSEPAVLTARVQLLCLPNRFFISELNLQVGVEGWVAGWGSDETDNLPLVLTKVKLPVIANPICIRDTIHFTGDKDIARTLSSNMFCAGHGADTPLKVCPGDSGSPMVFQSNASLDSPWTVEGIVSHFFRKTDCSMRPPGQYGIFTKVNRFTQWINEIMQRVF